MWESKAFKVTSSSGSRENLHIDWCGLILHMIIYSERALHVIQDAIGTDFSDLMLILDAI